MFIPPPPPIRSPIRILHSQWCSKTWNFNVEWKQQAHNPECFCRTKEDWKKRKKQFDNELNCKTLIHFQLKQYWNMCTSSKTKKIRHQINQANQSSKHNTGSQFPLDSNRKQSNSFKKQNKNKSSKTLTTEAEFISREHCSLYLILKNIFGTNL